MARFQVLLISALLALSGAAPQFGVDDQQPTPYEFEYGVNVQDTGDVKEHKEAVSQTGRTEGEYRWLQPNGLFLVVRYYVDGDSGFVADVSEEPASNVEARYRNTLGENIPVASTSGNFQSIAKSIDVAGPSSVGAAVNVINAPRPSFTRQPTFRPRPQTVVNAVRNFNTQQQQQQQQTFTTNDFSSQQQSFTGGDFIDGGIIDGGIIDGGIIDGGIIDGGIIGDNFSSFDDDSREASSVPVVLARRNRFQG